MSSLDHLLNQISAPVICSACADEFAAGLSDAGSLRAYSRFDVGFTERGFQVWCQRHETNVVEIDFDGHQLAADFRNLVPRDRG